MVKKNKLEVEKRVNGRKPESGRHSKYLDEFKKKTGLVSMDEIKSLPIDSVEALNRKIELMDKYTTANQRLVDLFGAVGGRAVNALNQVVDLQSRLLELEESCKEQGINPLEHPAWLKAREMLARETQFIHKHGLDAADTMSRVEARKKSRDDDDAFTIVDDYDE